MCSIMMIPRNHATATTTTAAKHVFKDMTYDPSLDLNNEEQYRPKIYRVVYHPMMMNRLGEQQQEEEKDTEAEHISENNATITRALPAFHLQALDEKNMTKLEKREYANDDDGFLLPLPVTMMNLKTTSSISAGGSILHNIVQKRLNSKTELVLLSIVLMLALFQLFK